MGNSDRFRSEDGNDALSSKKEADKAPADVFQEAIHEAFGAKDAERLLRAGDRLPNAPLQNLNLNFSNPSMPAGAVRESISMLGAAGAGAVLEATALRSAKELAFGGKDALKMNDVSSLLYQPGARYAKDVLNGRADLLQRYEAVQGLRTSAAAAETGLTASNAELKAIAEPYKTPFAELPGVSPQLARDRHLFFQGSPVSKIGYLNHSAKDYIGTADELGKGTKLFEAGSREATVLTALESNRKLQVSSAMSLREGEHAFLSNLKKLSAAEAELAGASYFSAGLKGFTKGALTSAASLTAASAVDTLMGNKSSMESTPRALLDGVAIPGVLLSELPGRYKAGIAGAAFVASRALGYMESRNVELSISRPAIDPKNLDISSSMRAPEQWLRPKAQK